ncbi:hypothetical protein HZC09_01055 [Candidatus Micrarchaeota archaeon]|nr:hypothetical protein [Candidatus Micrarchaeota archaeon]
MAEKPNKIKYVVKSKPEEKKPATKGDGEKPQLQNDDKKQKEQTKPEDKPRKNKLSYVLIAILAVIATGLIAWSLQNPAVSQIGSTENMTTKQLVTPVPVSSSQQTLTPVTATIAQIINNSAQYEGKLVTIQGNLGHRTRQGYGWNLKFDLFDDEGNSIRLNTVAPETETNLEYRATGTITKAAYGPEMQLNRLELVR